MLATAPMLGFRLETKFSVTTAEKLSGDNRKSDKATPVHIAGLCEHPVRLHLLSFRSLSSLFPTSSHYCGTVITTIPLSPGQASE